MNELAIKEFTSEQVQLIKDTIAKGATDQELQLFLYTCSRAGLDPLRKQAYAIKRWDAALRKEVMTAQTSIDGYRIMAERTGKYCPGKEPSFAYDKDGNLLSATSYIRKLLTNGEWAEFSATCFYDEYVQTTKEGQPNGMWRKMKHNQLAKCAESLAFRRGFPAELSGIYTHEEMGQADNEPPPQRQTERTVESKKLKMIQKEIENQEEPKKARPITHKTVSRKATQEDVEDADITTSADIFDNGMTFSEWRAYMYGNPRRSDILDTVMYERGVLDLTTIPKQEQQTFYSVCMKFVEKLKPEEQK